MDLRESSPIRILSQQLLTKIRPLSRSEGADGKLFDAIYKSITNTTADSHRSVFTSQVRQAYHLEKPS